MLFCSKYYVEYININNNMLKLKNQNFFLIVFLCFFLISLDNPSCLLESSDISDQDTLINNRDAMDEVNELNQHDSLKTPTELYNGLCKHKLMLIKLVLWFSLRLYIDFYIDTK